VAGHSKEVTCMVEVEPCTHSGGRGVTPEETAGATVEGRLTLGREC